MPLKAYIENLLECFQTSDINDFSAELKIPALDSKADKLVVEIKELQAGLDKLISEIFKPSDYYKNVNKSKDLIPLQEALGHIYSDKALLINEVTKDNLNDFWKNMAPLIRDTAKSNEELKDKFYKLLSLKELVSEFIWYILTGALVSSISYNYITSIPCSISADAMKELHDKHQEEELDEHLDNNNNERKIYSTRE